MQTKTLIVLALIGSLLIIFSTMYWGIGVTSDSVLYINSARSLLSGHGLLNIDDSPYTINPHLYPIIIAFIGYLFDLDPFIVAP